MVLYEDWNREIFSYYFNSSNRGLVFFCVDEKTIEYLGQKFGLKKEEALKNFCCAVIDKCKKVKTVDLGFRNYRIKDEVPYQTSVIAFTILAASRMREDDKFTSKNYWGRVDELIQQYYPSYCAKKGWDKDDNPFLSMFEEFAKYISEKYFKFEFQSIFKYKNDKNDLVGLPMYQSMISTKDKWILTKRFEKEIKDNEFLKYYKKIVADKTSKEGGFSTVFKKIRDEKDNVIQQALLQTRIEDFYQDWKENGFEYDEYNRLTKIRLKLGYKDSGEENFQFFYFLKDDIENTEPAGFESIFINGEKYYYRNIESTSSISLKNHSLDLRDWSETESESSKDKIILKSIGENYYIETRSVFVDDDFSVLFKKSAVSTLQEDYDEGYFEENENAFEKSIDGTNLILFQSFKALRYGCDYIQMSKKGKVRFQKGLKADIGKGFYSYIEGAEPLVYFEDVDYIKVYIDDDFQKIKTSPFCIHNNENYSKVGKNYSISLEKDTTPISYKIYKLDKSSFANENFKFIYHNLTPQGIIKDFEYNQNSTICSGSSFSLVEDFDSESSDIQTDLIDYNKIKYILQLLKMHTIEKKYPISNQIKNWAINYKTNNYVLTNLINYIKQNNYIDNYVNIYLKEIGKVLEWQKI